MILNETPIRTSKNFGANNINIENLDVPEEINKFNNRSIYINSEKEVLISEKSKDDELTDIDLYEDSKVLVTEIIKDNFGLKYGVDNTGLISASDKCNHKLRVVAKENASDANINIEFRFDENNKNLFDELEIKAEKNSKITITIKYLTDTLLKVYNDKNNELSSENETLVDDAKYFHFGTIKACGLEESSISIIFANMLNNRSTNIVNFENKLLDGAFLDYSIIDFGGKNSISNYYTDLLGKHSCNNVRTIYLGNEDQLFDLNYIAHLKGEQSNFDIEAQGALNDNAIKHFKGTIDFKKGAKKSYGNENENCLILSDKAKSLALPILLCSEEDVVGNHSTSSGKASSNELFYLMSRGFTEKDAMKLLVRARFNKILEELDNSEVSDLVNYLIETKL
jgi:Fe-S cluster assembly scaffold protein SufB